MSFVSQNGIKKMIEHMLVYSWPEHLQPLVCPFPRMTYANAMSEYGSDKPDTSFGVKVSNLFTSLHRHYLLHFVDFNGLINLKQLTTI